MTKIHVSFSPDEMACVLSHHGLGVIRQVRALNAGHRRVPKAVVEACGGRFLPRRRPVHGTEDLARVGLSHAIIRYLHREALPVSPLVPTRKRGETFVHDRGSMHELFEFVEGDRYDGSPVQTTEAGWLLQWSDRRPYMGPGL